MQNSFRHAALFVALARIFAMAPAHAAETTTKTIKTTETRDGETQTETETETMVEEDHGGGGAHKTNRHRHSDWIIREYGHHDRPLQLDVSVGPLYFDGVGVAVWLAIPIVPDGFIRPINDSFDLEFGLVLGGRWGFYDGVGPLGVAQYNGVFALIPVVGGRWNFFLTPAWSVFIALKFGAEIDVGQYGGAGAGFAAAVNVGGVWHFSDWVGLRLELGYPLPLSVGLSFDLGNM